MKQKKKKKIKNILVHINGRYKSRPSLQGFRAQMPSELSLSAFASWMLHFLCLDSLFIILPVEKISAWSPKLSYLLPSLEKRTPLSRLLQKKKKNFQNIFFLHFYNFKICFCVILFFFFICSGFCHILKWNSHGFTCVPHPDPPSHAPLQPLPLGFPSAPGPSACLMHPTWAGDLFHPR